VHLVEVNPEKLAALKAGDCPIAEPGLPELLGKHLSGGGIVATDDVDGAVGGSDLSMICVGTPSNPDGSPNLEQVARVVTEVAEVLRRSERPHTLVVRSTAPFPQVRDRILSPLRSRLDSRFGRHV